MKTSTTFLLTSGLRKLGQFRSLQAAVAAAQSHGSHQFCDIAVWSPEGELLAIVKDSEMQALATHWSTLEHDDSSDYLDLDALQQACPDAQEAHQGDDGGMVDLDSF